MKLNGIIILLLIITTEKIFSQEEKKNVQISFVQKENIFYEGEQGIYFDYIIENRSNKVSDYEKNCRPVIHKLRIDGELIIDRKDEDLIYRGAYKAFDPLPPNSICTTSHFINLNQFRIPSNSIQYYLGIPDSELRAYANLPTFLKPGNYNILLAWDMNKVLVKRNFEFKVIKATGKEKLELNSFLSSLFTLIDNSTSKDLNVLMGEGQPTLWNFLKNNPNSIYAQEALGFMAFYNLGSSTIRRFEEDIASVFKVYEIIPALNIRSTFMTAQLVSMWTKYFDNFEKNSLISNKKEYVDNYLKRLSGKPSSVSEELIKEMNIRYGISDLKNYSDKNK